MILSQLQSAFQSRRAWALLLFGLNLLSALLTNLHDDEAYYWLFSKHLDWGYFDHPPMVALFVKAGTTLFGNTLLGTRLVSVLAICGTWYLLTELLKERVNKNYMGLGMAFLATPILQVYGFLTTPDVPLFLFGTAFLLALKQLLNHGKGSVWMLALSMALLAYSKYHGALIVGFTLIPLLTTRAIFKVAIAGMIALVLFSPHLYWQYQHDWPSFQYHLVSRHDGSKWSHVFEMLLGVLLMSGALLFFKRKAPSVDKADQQFTRSLQFVFWGFIGFFALTLVNGKIELHWLGFISIPLLLLLPIDNILQVRWQRIALVLQMTILIVARFVLPFQYQNIEAFEKDAIWAEKLKNRAKGNPVVFMNSFQKASKYQFYTQSIGWSDNNSFYRKNQFDIWKHDTLLNNRDVYYITRYRKGSFIEDTSANELGGVIHNYGAYQRLTGSIGKIHYYQDGRYMRGELEFTLVNPYQYPLNFEHPEIGLEPSVYLQLEGFEDLVRLFPKEGEFSMPAASTKTFTSVFNHTNINRDISSGTAVLMLLKGPTYSQVLSGSYDIHINEHLNFQTNN